MLYLNQFFTVAHHNRPIQHEDDAMHMVFLFQLLKLPKPAVRHGIGKDDEIAFLSRHLHDLPQDLHGVDAADAHTWYGQRLNQL